MKRATPEQEHSSDAAVRARTAIVHDWFQGYHGAERAVDAMRRGLFAADNPPDVFTFHAARELLPAALSDSIVSESRISRLPGIRQRGHRPGHWRALLPYMPHYFSHLDLEAYDLVISSSHACAVNVRPRPDATHLCYCYTPIRYAWMPKTDRRAEGIQRLALDGFRRYLRRTDLAASARPDGYIAISSAVAERIQRFYGRVAYVIHPPVDVRDFDPGRAKDPSLFVWAHRLVPYKRPDLVAEAFRGLPYHLVMVGVGPLEARLRDRLPANVELLGWLPRERLAELYARASGFIHVGEEDFGITMVEALASGTPVIGLDRGGARDIVRHERDGLLLQQANLESLRSAIHEVARTRWDRDRLVARSSEFSRERFIHRLREYITEILQRERG